MTNLCRVFRAIADKTRQEILALLEDRERCVSDIVDHVKISQSAVSKHLTVLKNAGLVDDRRDGQQVIYSINRENMRSCCEDYFKSFECCSSLFLSRKGETQNS